MATGLGHLPGPRFENCPIKYTLIMNDQIWLLKEDDWEWHTVGFLFSEEKAKRWANRAEKGAPRCLSLTTN